jgi:hypothetical protein
MSRDATALERDYALGRALGRDAIERFALIAPTPTAQRPAAASAMA